MLFKEHPGQNSWSHCLHSLHPLIRKSYGYRCTPPMKFLGLLRYDLTALFYHIIVEALESLL